MATRESRGKESPADPKALREEVEILKEFHQPMLEILVRQDMTKEERGALILKRLPPEILIPLRERIEAVRAALPAKRSPIDRPGKQM